MKTRIEAAGEGASLMLAALRPEEWEVSFWTRRFLVKCILITVLFATVLMQPRHWEAVENRFLVSVWEPAWASVLDFVGAAPEEPPFDTSLSDYQDEQEKRRQEALLAAEQEILAGMKYTAYVQLINFLGWAWGRRLWWVMNSQAIMNPKLGRSVRRSYSAEVYEAVAEEPEPESPAFIHRPDPTQLDSSAAVQPNQLPPGNREPEKTQKRKLRV